MNRRLLLTFAVLAVASVVCAEEPAQPLNDTEEGKMKGAPSKDTLDFYCAQGEITSPGPHADLYEGLPDSPHELAEVVRGALIHIFHAHREGVVIPEERKKEVALRTVESILARLREMEDAPVAVKRSPDKRIVGNCRDCAVLLCSLMRHQGIPARARCGFATYFSAPGDALDHMDHWVCEYWNAVDKRWVWLDPQVDDKQREAFHIEFDTEDMPAGKFVPAGEVWQRCRAGSLDPMRCGIGELRGLDFVKGDLMRDFWALNKVEALPWDNNEFMLRPVAEEPEEYAAVFDRLARLCCDSDAHMDEIRRTYAEDPRLRRPDFQ